MPWAAPGFADTGIGGREDNASRMRRAEAAVAKPARDAKILDKARRDAVDAKASPRDIAGDPILVGRSPAVRSHSGVDMPAKNARKSRSVAMLAGLAQR